MLCATQDLSFHTCSFKDKNKFWKANAASRYAVSALNEFQTVIEDLNGVTFRANMLESTEERSYRNTLNYKSR